MQAQEENPSDITQRSDSAPKISRAGNTNACESAEEPRVKFGKSLDGRVYTTPFAVTSIYNPASLLESLVTAMLSQAQTIPVALSERFAAALETIEHPSPELIVFGEWITKENLRELIDRGFQLIHVLKRSANSHGDTNSDNNSDNNSDTDDNNIFSKNVVWFDVNDILDHLCLEPGLLAQQLVEYAVAAEYPSYKAKSPHVTHEKGLALMHSLSHGESTLTAVSRATALVDSFRGFDTLEQHIICGEAMLGVWREIAASAVESALNCSVREKSYVQIPPRVSADAVKTLHKLISPLVSYSVILYEVCLRAGTARIYDFATATPTVNHVSVDYLEKTLRYTINEMQQVDTGIPAREYL